MNGELVTEGDWEFSVRYPDGDMPADDLTEAVITARLHGAGVTRTRVLRFEPELLTEEQLAELGFGRS